MHGLGSEQLDEGVEFARRPRRPLERQGLPDRPLAASGEHRPLGIARSSGAFGEIFQVVDRASFLGAAELRVGDRGGEAVIALFASREHEQVRAGRIGLAVLRAGESQRQLGPEHRLHRAGLGRFGEAHDAVEPVVIGEREGVQTEAFGLFDEFFGRGGSVEE